MRTRREWTAEQKLDIVMEALKGGNVSETCRKHELSPTVYQRWLEDALAGAKQGLSDKRKPENRDPLVEENRKLLELAGKQALILDLQKKVWGNRLE